MSAQEIVDMRLGVSRALAPEFARYGAGGEPNIGPWVVFALVVVALVWWWWFSVHSKKQ